MQMRLWMSIAAAGLLGVGLLVAGGSSLSQAQNESAQQNVRESQQYESLLCTNPGFRAKRIAQECGPVTDPQLHESCVASFQCSRQKAAPRWRHAPPSETIR